MPLVLGTEIENKYNGRYEKEKSIHRRIKNNIVSEILREEEIISQIAVRLGDNPLELGRGETELLEQAAGIFKRGSTLQKMNREKKHAAKLKRKTD